MTRITSPLLGRSHYTKYRIPPRVQHTHTHTVLYIYIISIPLWNITQRSPSYAVIPRSFQPSSCYLFCFACSFQTQVGQGDYCQMSACVTSDKQNKTKPTIISANNLSQRNLRRPAHLKKLGKFFVIWFQWVTHIFVKCFVQSDPATG